MNGFAKITANSQIYASFHNGQKKHSKIILHIISDLCNLFNYN